jgi:hypothetical protein
MADKYVTFRIHLIYQADGMKRPLSHRQELRCVNAAEALQLTINYIRSAFVSGFKVLSWTAENLDAYPGFRYVGGAFADEVHREVVDDLFKSAKRVREELGL